MLLPEVQVFPQGVVLVVEWSTLLLYLGLGAVWGGGKFLLRRSRGAKSQN